MGQKSVVAGALWIARLVEVLFDEAQRRGVSFDELAVLTTPEGQPLREQLMREIIARRPPPKKSVRSAPPAEQHPVGTIRNRMKIRIDRETPLEDQFAALAAEDKIRGDWWRRLTSENSPSDKSRPTEITLGECSFGVYFSNGDTLKAAIAGTKGVVRNGDPYEFVAWLRHMSKAGLEYRIAALNKLCRDLNGRHYAPCAREIGAARLVDGNWIEDYWDYHWFFLVVCEE